MIGAISVGVTGGLYENALGKQPGWEFNSVDTAAVPAYRSQGDSAGTRRN